MAAARPSLSQSEPNQCPTLLQTMGARWVLALMVPHVSSASVVVCARTHPLSRECGLKTSVTNAGRDMWHHCVAVLMVCSANVLCWGVCDAKSRWFAMHALVNVVIAAQTAPIFFHIPSVLRDGDIGAACTASAPAALSSKLPIAITLWLHLWHVAFFRLSKDDIIHHAVFVGVLVAPATVWNWGVCGNMCLFFVCGLPGAVIYGTVAAQRMGYLQWINEPVLTNAMNSYLRAPGVLFVQPFLWHAYWTSRTEAPAAAVLAQLLLCPVNAVYYARQARERMLRRQKSLYPNPNLRRPKIYS